jgi:two-component system, NtrC family, nitrogen regulation sensor histidine kinase NtrY
MAFDGEAMSFRRRLLVLFSITVFVSVAVVTLIVSTMARRALDHANDERTAALVAQFRRDFSRRGEELGRRIQAVASTPQVTQMVVAAARPSPDYGVFLDDAQLIAETQRLDFLEFTDDHGTIISSAQWPAKFGYKEPLATSNATPNDAFLKEEETPTGPTLGLFAIRTTTGSDHKIYAIGGIRLDKAFLSTLELPAGMRVMLYENLHASTQNFSSANLISAGEPIQKAQQLAGFIQAVQRSSSETGTIIRWSPGEDETVNAFPLLGDKNQLLAILLVGSSRRAYGELRTQIRSAALVASGAGLLLAIVLSSWASARVTKPVEDLARAAHELAAGNWNTKVATTSHDEIGELAESFNRMTHDLLDQRERLVQTERVAAWRDLARRLAHELKNPLFPLQLTVENLLRAREQGQQQFDDTFRESAATLLAEISNLKTIIARFSDFSKMPQPHFQPVQLTGLIQEVINLHQAQFAKSNIVCQLELAENLQAIAADPDLLHRAMSNLVLNAIEAMPEGGILSVRTRHESNSASIEISDSGKGLSAEECSRLFTPYYTSKAQGTGLGLAIVQSIVSDHGGRISVRSQQGRGTTLIIDLPANRDKLSAGTDTSRTQGTQV